jgi:hypothetical protein
MIFAVVFAGTALAVHAFDVHPIVVVSHRSGVLAHINFIQCESDLMFQVMSETSCLCSMEGRHCGIVMRQLMVELD